MKIQKLLFVAIIASMLSCQTEEMNTPSEINQTNMASNQSIDKTILSKVKSLHLNPEGIKKIEIQQPDGSRRHSLLIEGDLAIDLDQLNSMTTGNITDKQYRTYNLVSSPRVIEIVGLINYGAPFDLTSKQQNALMEAVENYNDINIGLSFSLSFSNTFATADILVYQNPGDAGGVAGFPSAGNPYDQVVIFSGMEQFSLETNTHVMTHEIGHTIGLRHSDWFTRQSCGRPSFGELANPSGAVHIPGTPYRLDPSSVMLSCFSTNEDGEFGPYDVVALEYLY